MQIITDDVQFAHQCFDGLNGFRFVNLVELDKSIQALANDIFSKYNYYISEFQIGKCWNYLFISRYAERSHYDILIDNLNRKYTLPEGILCLTAESLALRGFRINRPWIGLPGNIHLSVFLSPDKEIMRYNTGFMILSALSVIQTIDKIEELNGKSMIKWINDILINDTKVCGLLAYSQIQGRNVLGSVLGIGLNVESRPTIEPTKFVPKAGCLNDFLSPMSRVSMKEILPILINSLEENYNLLLSGNYQTLFDLYCERSVVINKVLRIWSDPMEGEEKLIYEGRAVKIGENLELFVEGRDEPISSGRLELI